MSDLDNESQGDEPRADRSPVPLDPTDPAPDVSELPPTPEFPEAAATGNAFTAPESAPERSSASEAGYEVVTGELPVCDYTGEPTDEPCEEPATVKRWSSAAVVVSAAMGALVGGAIVALVAAFMFGGLLGVRLAGDGSPSSGGSSAGGGITISPESNLSFSEAVAEKVTPSVVNVTTEQARTDFWSGATDLFETGNGSGVIIRDDGHILTNYHVIEGADRIIVNLGPEDAEATVVGVDRSSDLAVLKVEGQDMPAIEVGSSQDLRVGQFVVAVGSPFGLDKTVTAGIISALQRSSTAASQTNTTTYANLIQTDAAINPGNSGGALVDEQGKLIGINTLIESPSGTVGAAQSAGIGFAIPVDLAMNIAEQIIETGKATHPFLGASTATIDENIAAQYNLPVDRGAIVQLVEPGSPADEAGLQRGDIIVAINGDEVSSFEDVFAAIRSREIGDALELTVVRGETERELTATLGSDAER